MRWGRWDALQISWRAKTAMTGWIRWSCSSTLLSDLSSSISTCTSLPLPFLMLMLMAWFLTFSSTHLLMVTNTYPPSSIFLSLWLSFITSSPFRNAIHLAGFSVTSQGCCGVENGRVQWSCIAGAAPCNNRNSYVFWDSLHPTEALNRIVAQRSFMGPQSDVYPFNIQQLVSI